MSPDFLLGLVAALGAVIATLSSVLQAATNFVSAHFDRKRLAAAKTDQVLANADFDELGNFLFETLGNTTLGAYSRDATVQKRLELALRSISQYLNDGARGTSSTGIAEIPEPFTTTTDHKSGSDLAAVSAAESGEWNALAAMRRDIETKIVSAFGTTRASLPIGASQLIDLANRLEYLSGAEASQLMGAVRIANAAIHGEDVSFEDAVRALGLASEFLSKKIEPGSWPLPGSGSHAL